MSPPTFRRGLLRLELPVLVPDDELAPERRRIAWQAHVALTSRRSTCGPLSSLVERTAPAPLPRGELAPTLQDFEGLREDLVRLATRMPPAADAEGDLPMVLLRVLRLVVVPFLARLRSAASGDGPTLERLGVELEEVRSFLRGLSAELARSFAFPDPCVGLPVELAASWEE